MSFLSRRRHDGDHHHRHQGNPPALDLLDEYWFFSNTLVVNNSGKQAGGGSGTKAKAKAKPPPLPSRSPSTSMPRSASTSTNKLAPQQQAGRLGSRIRLLRTPSMPSPRVRMEEEEGEETAASSAGFRSTNKVVLSCLDASKEDEVDDDDLNWSSIYEGVLRTRMAERRNSSRSSPALHRAPSMPVVPSSSPEKMATKSTPSMPRLRHSYSTLLLDQRHTPSAQDLEDKEKKKNLQVADVLPAAAAIRDARSAAEMKDQLRMWAQAVACNVRQEC